MLKPVTAIKVVDIDTKEVYYEATLGEAAQRASDEMDNSLEENDDMLTIHGQPYRLELESYPENENGRTKLMQVKKM